MTNALASALVLGIKRLVRRTGPWILGPVLLIAGVAATQIPPEKRRRVAEDARAAFEVMVEFAESHAQLMASFRRATPARPSWESLVSTVGPDHALLRACLHALARSPDSNVSASELVRTLPTWRIEAGSADVEAVVNRTPCFEEVWLGYWQLGVAHEDVLAALPTPAAE